MRQKNRPVLWWDLSSPCRELGVFFLEGINLYKAIPTDPRFFKWLNRILVRHIITITKGERFLFASNKR